LLIQTVAPGSAAERVGLKPGDMIVKIDNVTILNQQQFTNTLATCGGKAELLVRRAPLGQAVNITVDFTGFRDARVRAPYLLGVLGQFTPRGMQVRKVYDDSPASRSGVKVGDLLLAINGNQIGSHNDFFKALYESAGEAVLDIRRGAKQGQIKTRLELYRFGTLGDYPGQGARFEEVAPLTPAGNAGFKPGDIALSLNNQSVRNDREFDRAVDQSNGSVVVKVRKQFGGVTEVRVNVVNNSLGAWCEPADGGMRVVTVNQGQLAAKLGLQRDDVVLRVDGRRVQSLDELQSALERARGFLTLQVRSGLTGQFGRLQADLRQ
jgi:S1-C subfamily serine protease